MSSSFSTKLQERFAVAAAARTARQDASVSQMEDQARRTAAFEPVGGEIHRSIIRPMVEEVVRAFDNCTVEHYKTPLGFSSRCHLTRTDHYPAGTRLTIGVAQSAGGPGAVLTYDLEIIPVLMDYVKTDSHPVDLDRPDLDAVREKVGEWLLRFTDTYLRLESEPNYQEWHMHVDPVCGMRLTGTAVARVVEHARRKFYFCSDACRARFEAHPALYLTGQVPLST